MQFEVNAKKREVQGTSASRRLRRQGRVPGVVYGGSEGAVSIDMDHNELFLGMRHEAFQSSIITLTIDGAATTVLLRDAQVHPFKREILHVDFQRVAADQKIHVKVPLHFINADIAPGVKLGGGIVSHVATELDVSCLPGKLPEFIEVDLKDLVAGHSIHVSDLAFPEGVEPVLHKGENPVVATILGAKVQAEEGEGEGEAQ